MTFEIKRIQQFAAEWCRFSLQKKRDTPCSLHHPCKLHKGLIHNSKFQQFQSNTHKEHSVEATPESPRVLYFRWGNIGDIEYFLSPLEVNGPRHHKFKTVMKS